MYFATIKNEFVVPPKRSIEALWVGLPLVPDAAFATLWERYPQYHPDEAQTFQRWRELFGDTYDLAEDPGDPEKGHGADLARTFDPDHPATLLPDAKFFGDPPPDLAGADDPDREGLAGERVAPDLLREYFFEALLNGLLARARESQDQVRTWEEAKKAFDGGTGADPGPRPEEVTFAGLLEKDLADVRPGDGAPRWLGSTAPRSRSSGRRSSPSPRSAT